jgi:hypothetical protein
MGRLNKVMRRVDAFLANPPKPKPEALVEIEAVAMDGVDVEINRKRRRRNNNSSVIIDGTGGDSHTPQVNTTRFKIKPKIVKKNFVADNGLSLIQENESINRRRKRRNNNSSVIIDGTGGDSHTPQVNTTRFNIKPKIAKKNFVADVLAEMDSVIVMDRRRRKRKNNSSLIIDGTGSAAHTPQVNLTRFNIKPKLIKKNFVPDVLTELSSNIERRRKRRNNNSTLIIDGTGGASHTPQVNTTRFKIKPKIVKKGFVPDVLVEMVASLERKDTSARSVVIDGTGSVPQGGPRVNLNKFNKKPKIVKSKFVQDSALQPTNNVQNKILMETETTDCPTCKKVNMKQDHEVVISTVSSPNPHEAGIRQEQQDAINHLIKPVANTLSIKEVHLNQAGEALKEADGVHERFHEFKEKAQNTPLIPESLK